VGTEGLGTEVPSGVMGRARVGSEAFPPKARYMARTRSAADEDERIYQAIYIIV